MMSSTGTVIALAAAWLFIPGLLVGAALRLRGWLLAGLAPALSMSLVAAASQLSSTAGLRWAPWLVVALVAVVVVVLVPITRPWRRAPVATATGHPWSWWHHVGVAAAVVTTAVTGLIVIGESTGAFTKVNQTWDAFFHAAAVRLIVEQGDPAPAALGAIAAPASTDFFSPDIYHATVALLVLSTDAPVMVGINALAGILPLVLAVGVVALLRVTTTRPAHAAVAALLAGTVVAVPFHMIGYGTLLPYGTALVMLAGVLALLHRLLQRPEWPLGLALGLALAGLLQVHPQVAFLAVIAGVLQFGWHVTRTRTLDARLAVGLGLGIVAFLTLGAPVLLATLGRAAGAGAVDWPAYTSAGGALGDLLLFNAASTFPQWWLAPLLLIGLILLLRGQEPTLRPLVAAAGVWAGLYVLASAYDTPLSLAVTSFWWNDRHRLAAAFAVVAILLAAVGLVWLRDRILAALPRLSRGALERTPRLIPALTLTLGMIGFFVVSGDGYAAATRASVDDAYAESATLTAAEQTGLTEAAEVIRASGGGLALNDPHDGCAWIYPLQGVRVVFPTPLTEPFDWRNLGDERRQLFERFNEIDTDRAVAADAERLDVRWVLLCTGYIREWQTRATGLQDLDRVRSAEIVYTNGAVQLYRLGDPADAGASAG